MTAQALICGDRLACIPTAIRRLLLALTVSRAPAGLFVQSADRFYSGVVSPRMRTVCVCVFV